MWSDNTNFDEAKKNIQQLLLAESGNQEDSAGITRPTPDQLALPKPKRVAKPSIIATGKPGATPSGGNRDGTGPILTRDVEEKLTSYEKQIADLKAQLANALGGRAGSPRMGSPRMGGLGAGMGAEPISRSPRFDPVEEKKKQDRLAVLLEMGVVTKEEYVEKLSVITSPRESPPTSHPGSGATSPKGKRKKLDGKISKLNELLSMGIITQDEYDERLAKIKEQA